MITETNAKGHIISYEYDDAGNLLKKRSKGMQTAKTGLGAYNYDYIGRLTSKPTGTKILYILNTTGSTS